MNKPVQRALQVSLLVSRWLLAPFYIMLAFGLCLLLFKGGAHLYEMTLHVTTITEGALTIDLLKLVDLTLLASLIVIVIVSGYENFITAFERDAHADWPVWMSQIDFAGLKLKLLGSILAIATIQLLEVYLDLPNVSERDIRWYVMILLAFALAGLLMALTDYLNHKADAHKTDMPSSDH